MAEIPFGQPESQILEFKGRDALKDPWKIAREVVGMLNAEGGEIWVGLAEEAGRAVKVEAIADVETARQSLRDALVDSIEPALESGEIGFSAEKYEGSDALLRLKVSPLPEKQPYAALRQQGRYFGVRVADRLREMTRQEIAERFGKQASIAEKAQERSLSQVYDARENARRTLGPSFWFCLKPVQPIEVDTQSNDLRRLLSDSTGVHSRSMDGHYFAYFVPYERVAIETGQGRVEATASADRRLVVKAGGEIEYSSSLGYLELPQRQDEIAALWIMELPRSLFRLAARIYSHAPETTAVYADLALFGLRGWRLRPGSPMAFEYLGNRRTREAVFDEGDYFHLLAPLTLSVDEIRREPERCAFRMIRELYEAFGFREQDMPPEYDRRSGRLVIPE